MPPRLTGWSAAILATLITLALVVGELTDARQRRWRAARPLTTDTVASLLVLLITVLVVNQLLNRQQSRQRAHAIAAQAAIMVAQAARSVKATPPLPDGSGDRDAASDSFRTYMMMRLIGAPVLMDDPAARHFLEQSQYLGGVMGRALAAADRPAGSAAGPDAAIDDAIKQISGAAAPLMRQLSPAIRDAVQRMGQTAEEQGHSRPRAPGAQFLLPPARVRTTPAVHEVPPEERRITHPFRTTGLNFNRRPATAPRPVASGTRDAHISQFCLRSFSVATSAATAPNGGDARAARLGRC